MLNFNCLNIFGVFLKMGEKKKKKAKSTYGGVGLCFQTTIFSFQITFHIFSRTFSPTHIFTNVFK